MQADCADKIAGRLVNDRSRGREYLELAFGFCSMHGLVGGKMVLPFESETASYAVMSWSFGTRLMNLSTWSMWPASAPLFPKYWMGFLAVSIGPPERRNALASASSRIKPGSLASPEARIEDIRTATTFERVCALVDQRRPAGKRGGGALQC